MNDTIWGRRRQSTVMGVCAAALLLATAATAAPQPAESAASRLRRVEALLAAQAAQIADQQQEIASQRAELRALKTQLTAPRNAPGAGVLAPHTLPGGALAENTPDSPPPTITAASFPTTPVGQAPDTNVKPLVLASIPQNLGVLTPRGHFVFEPSVEYDRVGTDRLVFDGAVIAPGVLLGPLDAGSAAQDVAIGTADLRYGVTDRLEVEVRVPYLYNHDRLSRTAAPGAPPSPATSVEGADLGDVEFAARYQLTRAREGKPVFIASLKARSDTGVGPYDVNFDSSGVATSLPSGAGFWGLEPGMTVLLPSDPVVLFFNLGYMRNFPGNVNRTIGATHVGDVHPGDSIDSSFGFAFAINPRFSYSLGFSNSYIYGASRRLNGLLAPSNDIEAGSLTLGLSYRLRENVLWTTNVQVGVTPDAPNLQVNFRVPISF